jgi:amidase
MPRAPYADAFRVAWESSAARLPMVPGIDLSALTPLVSWLVARGQALTGTQVLDAMTALDTFSAALIGTFDRFDAVLTPTLALTPRPLGWYGDDPEEDFRRQCAYSPWTSMANVAGLPAITLPVGVTEEGHPDGAGLPMGVQLIGRPGGERVLLAIGAQLERRLRWQRRHPPTW